MKHYDFEAVQRRGTGSMKWAEMEKYDCPEGVIPFSVADMELKVMPEVVDGLKEFLDKSPLGYCNPDERFNAAVCRWERDRHGWDIRPEWLLGAPGVINAFFTAVHAFTAPATACCFSRRYIIQCIWPPRETTGRSLARRLSTRTGTIPSILPISKRKQSART